MPREPKVAVSEHNPGEVPRRKRSFAVQGDLLRRLRMARGWTQAEAAQQADVSTRLIGKAESGGPLELKTIAALAMLYSARDERLEPEQLLASDEKLSSPVGPRESLHARVQRWLDAEWVEQDFTVIEELAIPDFVYHAEWGLVRGAEEMKARVLEFLKSFSNVKMVAEEVLDLGEAIAVRWRATMVHTGPWLGLEATSRDVVIHGSSWVEMVGDKFGDAWDFWDPGVIYQQLTSLTDSTME